MSLSLYLTILTLLASIVLGTTDHEINPHNADIHSINGYSSSECCAIFMDGDDTFQKKSNYDVLHVLKCVNNSLSMTQKLKPSVLTFAIFASSEIYQYAAHTALANALYLERRGYAGRLLSVDTGDDFYPKDRRWNKIQSVVKALTPANGWASLQDSLIFIDTDLVVLNWSLNPAEALSRFPLADLILSADALDVGNTGFLIIRNTVWSRMFFQEWWDSRHMPGTFCDQHVFNKLYAALKANGQSHKVAILANNAVNSRWPALETFSSNDRVLHLMGETTPYRTAVARFASQGICQARNKAMQNNVRGEITADVLEPHILPQLGFSQNRLVSLARMSLEEVRDRLFTKCAATTAVEEDFDRLHEAITNTCDDKRPYLSSTPQQCETLFLREFQLTLQALNHSTVPVKVDAHGSFDMPAEMLATNKSGSYRLYLADHMTKVLYDIVYFTPKARKQQAAQRMLDSLTELSAYVNMNQVENRRYFAHKRGLLHAQLCTFYMLEGDWQVALHDGVQAVDELSAVMTMTDQANPDFSGFLLEYIEISSKIAEIFIHLTAFSDAVEWAEIALQNAETLFQTYSGEERVMAQQLAKLHLLLAEAFLRSGQLDSSRHQLALSRMSKLALDTEDNLSASLRSKEQSLIRELE